MDLLSRRLISITLLAVLATCAFSADATGSDEKSETAKVSYEDLWKEVEGREGQELIVINFRKRFVVGSSFEHILEKFKTLLRADGLEAKEWIRTTGLLEVGMFIEGGDEELKKFHKAIL